MLPQRVMSKIVSLPKMRNTKREREGVCWRVVVPKEGMTRDSLCAKDDKYKERVVPKRTKTKRV